MITKPSIAELIQGLTRNLEMALHDETGASLAPAVLTSLGVIDRLAAEMQSHQLLLQEDNEDIRQTIASLGVTPPAAPEQKGDPALDPAQLTLSRLEEENRTLKQAIVEAIEKFDLPADNDDKNIDDAIVSLLLRILHREDRIRSFAPRVPPTSGDPNLKSLPAEELESALQAFFKDEIPAAANLSLRNLEPASGGASREAWLFDVSWTEDGAERFEECILMREPVGSVLVSDKEPGQMTGTRRTTMDEINAIQVMDKAGIPVAPVLWSDFTGKWLERPFFISKRLPGTADVAPLAGSPDGPKVLADYVGILAKLHTLDPHALDLPNFGDVNSQNATQVQVELFERNYLEQCQEPYPAVVYLIRWLKKNQPDCNRVSVIHGDYRLGNFLHKDGKIVGVIDWEQVHLGDPAEELAFMYWALWSLEAFCPIEDFVAMYEQASGLTISKESLAYYRVFIELKMFVVGLTGMAAFYAKPQFQIHYGSATNIKLIRDAQIRAMEELRNDGPTVAFNTFTAKDFLPHA